MKVLAMLCFLFLLPIQMTLLLLPKIFYFILKTSAALLIHADIGFKYLDQDFPIEFIGWIQYIFGPSFAFMIGSGVSFIYGILSIPIYFWNLFWHPNGRSIVDMLANPNGNGRFISSRDKHHHRWREQARFTPRWVQRCRWYRFYWSRSHSSQRETVILGYDSRLCMFSFYQIHPSSINKTDGGSSSECGVTADVKMSTKNWIQRGVTKYSWLFKTFKNSRSKYPPRGLISSFLIFLTTIGIITILTGMKCHQILSECPSSVDSAS
jgi:hypothetical protein